MRAAGTPKSILFICHGNVCRSPYAEAVLSRPGLLRLRNTSVASAGFIGPDRSSPDAALAVAGRRGVDMREHRSQLMSTELLARPALLVVMDARQRRAVSGMAGRPASEILILGDLDPLGADRRGIKDPWGKPEAVFEEVYERVERCVLEMARLLNEAAEVAEG